MEDRERKIGEDVAVIKSKVTDMEAHMKEQNGAIKEQSKDIGKLKGWRNFITGGLAILAIMIPVTLFLVQFLV